MNTKKILKDMTLVQRYNTIECYRGDCFKVLNRAIPDLARRDILLTTSTLEILQEVEKVIQNDIDNLNIGKINVENILAGVNQDELSLFIKKACAWTMWSLQESYDAIKREEVLNKTWSLESRQKELQKLDKNILEIEESIEVLSEINIDLVKSQQEELDRLRKRKETILGTLNFKTEKEIQIEIYGYVYSYLNNILKNVQDDIEYLERFV